MLKKGLKVSKQTFVEAFKKSRTLSSDHLTLRFYKSIPKDGEKPPFLSKFSVNVPKSVSKKAVIRNLLKRRGYSAIKNNLNNLKNSYICMFSFKKGSDIITFAQIKEEITYLLKRSGIIDF